MSFKLEIWDIHKLLSLYEKDNIDLNPPYQRNSIWSVNSQKLLVDTLKNDLPIPAFFIQEKDDNKYEMVDGQQRTRAILAYKKGEFKDVNDESFTEKDFSEYKIAVNILHKELPVEKVREFYVRVNKTGLKLERPELNKAEFFDTSFLKLVSELSELNDFNNLKLFTPSVKKRMFDRDFIEELVALLLNGENDKKKAVDNLFKQDIEKEEYAEIEKNFKSILNTISYLDKNIPIAETRFKQKNDFYTLFGLIKRIKAEDLENIFEIYKTLIKISKGISPSNDDCEILQDYAFNCITQSNSKKARLKRINILEKILLNEENKPNKEQKAVAKFFGSNPELKKVGKYYVPKI